MAIARLNLALLSPAERMVVHADLIACRLRLTRTDKGWREWARCELEQIPEPLRQAVKDALNLRGANDR